jgi:hypothetical protein
MLSQPGSPLSSPTKVKKQKMSGMLIDSRIAYRLVIADITISYSSFASRNREKALNLHHLLTCANSGQNAPGSKSQSKIPSRLRESSTASFLEPEATVASPGSRSSSPGTAATPTSSVPGNAKPNGTAGGGVGEKRVPGRISSPPRPPPVVTRRPETDYLVGEYVCCAVAIFG